MKNEKHTYLTIDTMVLAAAGIWFISVLLNLVV
jgi:hypothetical protein